MLLIMLRNSSPFQTAASAASPAFESPFSPTCGAFGCFTRDDDVHTAGPQHVQPKHVVGLLLYVIVSHASYAVAEAIYGHSTGELGSSSLYHLK